MQSVVECIRGKIIIKLDGKNMKLNSMKFLIAFAALLASPLAVAATYAYDNLNRLTSVTFDSGPPQIYTYDAAGNMLSMTTTGVAKSSQSISFGASPVLAVAGTGTVSATASSALPVSYTSTTPLACSITGSSVTGVAAGTCTIAANQAGDANFNAAPQATLSFAITSTPVIPPVNPGGGLPTVTLNFALGWNLMGNSVNAPLDVATTLGNPANVTTVWKWIPATSRWAFYAPSMTAPTLATYASGKGYDVLTTINGGEGFWVNAKSVFTAQLPTGTAISSTSFANQTTPPNGLPMGWSLIAVGDNPLPRNFANTLSVTPPVAPAIAATSLTTLWAWDSTLSNWYFYAPSLDNSGGLAAYITSKGYLDFATKMLYPTTGFWVNHP